MIAKLHNFMEAHDQTARPWITLVTGALASRRLHCGEYKLSFMESAVCGGQKVEEHFKQTGVSIAARRHSGRKMRILHQHDTRLMTSVPPGSTPEDRREQLLCAAETNNSNAMKHDETRGFPERTQESRRSETFGARHRLLLYQWKKK